MSDLCSKRTAVFTCVLAGLKSTRQHIFMHTRKQVTQEEQVSQIISFCTHAVCYYRKLIFSQHILNRNVQLKKLGVFNSNYGNQCHLSYMDIKLKAFVFSCWLASLWNKVSFQLGVQKIFSSALCVPVKEKLTADPDSEIATTSLRVSLMCPVKT